MFDPGKMVSMGFVGEGLSTGTLVAVQEGIYIYISFSMLLKTLCPKEPKTLI